MSNVGDDTRFPKRSSTKFVVQNVAPNNKRVRVFNFPINNGATRDLLAIPSVSEADICHSLLKGELSIKLDPLVRELIIVDSDINLLQFNAEQKAFLQSAGIVDGISITRFALKYIYLQDISLVGVQDNVNLIFTIPSGDFVIIDNYKIIVYLNGVRQEYLSNYLIAESQGVGTGYDTVIFVDDAPDVDDVIVADYYQAS